VGLEKQWRHESRAFLVVLHGGAVRVGDAEAASVSPGLQPPGNHGKVTGCHGIINSSMCH